jgi:hypothetical protein
MPNEARETIGIQEKLQEIWVSLTGAGEHRGGRFSTATGGAWSRPKQEETKDRSEHRGGPFSRAIRF